MQIDVHTTEGTARVALRGRFDFHCHREFRSACDGALGQPGASGLEIDFSGVDYLDSSALGMLLLVRERAQGAQRAVRLANCRGIVADVLKVANFGKLFPIS